MANGKVIIDANLNDAPLREQLGSLGQMAGRSLGTDSKGGLIGRMFGGVKGFVGAVAGMKVINAGLNEIWAGFSGGLDRYDTMNRFPKMMQQIGFEASDSDRAIRSLAEGIEGLPTTLNDVTSTTQSLALMTRDLDGAVETTLALNNAFLASGSSSSDASRGLIQYTQMLAKGEPDLQSWRTLMETMPVALYMVSEELGYSGNNLYALYDAMKDGEITFDDFNNALIKVNEQQGGLAEMALANSEGIATSMANIRTAITKGWANIIETVDKGMELLGFGNLAKSLTALKEPIASAFEVITGGLSGAFKVAKAVQSVFKGIGKTVNDFIEPLKEGFTDFFEPVTKGFDEIGEAIHDFVGGLDLVFKNIGQGRWGDAFKRLGNNTRLLFKRLTDSVSSMLSGMKENIFDAFDAESWGDVARGAIQSLTRAFDSAKGYVSNVGQNIKNWIFESLEAQSWSDVASIIYEKLTSALYAVKVSLSNVGNAIKTAIFEAVGAESWAEVGELVITQIGNYMKWRIEMIGNIAGAIKDFIFQQAGVTSWGELGELIMSNIGTALDGAKNSLGDIGSKIEQWIFDSLGTTSWGGVAKKITDGIGGAIKFVTDISGEILSWIGKQVDEIDFNSVGKDIGDAIGGAIKFVTDLSGDFFRWVSGSIEDVDWNAIGTDIGSFISGAINAINSWDIDLHGLTDSIMSAVEEGIQAGFDIMQGVFTGFIEGIEWNFGGKTYNWSEETGEFIEVNADGRVSLVDIDFDAKGSAWVINEAVKAGIAQYDNHGNIELRPIADIIPSETNLSPAEIAKVYNDLAQALGQDTVDAEVFVDTTAQQGEVTDNTNTESAVQNALPDSVQAQVEAKIEILKGQGFSASRIQQLIDAEFGSGTYESVVNTKVDPNINVDTSNVQSSVNEQMPDEIPFQTNFKGEGGFVMGEGVKAGAVSAGQGLGTDVGFGIDEAMGKYQFTQLEGMVSSAMASLNQQFRAGFEQIKLTAGQAMQGVGNQMNLGMSQINLSSSFALINTQFRTGLESLKMLVLQWGTGIANQTTLAMNQMTMAVQLALTQISMNFSLSLTSITLAVTMALTSIQLSFSTTMTMISSDVSMNLSLIQANVLQTMQIIADTVSNQFGVIEMTVSASMQSVYATVSTNFALMNTAIAEAMSSAVSSVQSGMDSIISAMNSSAERAYSAGRNVAIGLANGINSYASVAVNAARAMANAVNAALTSVFRFGSPSKVTTQMGKWIPQGLANGIKFDTPLVAKASERMAKSAMPSIDPNVSMGLGGHAVNGALAGYHSEVHLHIDKFENHTDRDLPQLVEELHYYEERKRLNFLGG